MGEPLIESLSFDSNRRFGVELEVLAFDKENRPKGEKMPKGTEHVVMLVKENVEESVEARGYEHTQENNNWVVKPDSSCGLEICTPPLRGWRGIRKVCKVVEAFKNDPKIEIDRRCSVHVHVEVADLERSQIASVIAQWIKCEPIFMDLVPNSRKLNRYCQLMGMTNLFEHDQIYAPDNLIKKVGEIKYFSMNSKSIKDGLRNTLEIRIIEGEGCKDPYLIKNWLRLILHFVERTSKMPMPKQYTPNDPWSSLLWLDTKDVMKVLGFGRGQYELSKGLTQTRNWMLARLMKFMTPDVGKGPRWKAYAELKEILKELEEDGVIIDPKEHLSPIDLADALYNDSLRF